MLQQLILDLMEIYHFKLKVQVDGHLLVLDIYYQPQMPIMILVVLITKYDIYF